MRRPPVGVPINIADVPSPEGHFKDKRPNGSQKILFGPLHKGLSLKYSSYEEEGDTCSLSS
jgi:hypothetical protein